MTGSGRNPTTMQQLRMIWNEEHPRPDNWADLPPVQKREVLHGLNESFQAWVIAMVRKDIPAPSDEVERLVRVRRLELERRSYRGR